MSRRLVVEADGGSRGNPGPAGYGAVVRDADTGDVLAERAEGLGRVTNNVAEYRGLIAGLTAAAQIPGVSSVLVQMDSKLVVEQMSGRWKVKHPDMVPLARDAAALLRTLPPTRFQWIPRERNKHADRLANEAMDAQADGTVWEGETAAALPLPLLPGEPDTLPSEPLPPEPLSPETLPSEPVAAGWSAPTGAATRTLLLRHGQTPLSVTRAFSGRGDPELTVEGRLQAADAARRVAALVRDGRPVLVSSPLRRAAATAAAVAAELGAQVQIEDRLIETDFGRWEGHTFAEVGAKWPDELDAWLASPDVAPPGGESFTATLARVRELRDDWLADYPGRTVIAVSHVSPIKSFARLALDGGPAALYRMHLDLCGLSAIDWYADGPASLRTWNSLT